MVPNFMALVAMTPVAPLPSMGASPTFSRESRTWNRRQQRVVVRSERRWAAMSAATATAVAMAGSLLLSGAGWATADATSTPYAQVQQESELEVGLVNGKIRPCPSDINPNCVSTSSRFGAFSSLPWVIPKKDSTSPIEEIERVIMSTEKNPSILDLKQSQDGGYLLAEVDGFLGRDIVEFLVRDDVVTYRSMAKKVVYVYPFTTPLTDFNRQQNRIKSLEDKLGWGRPELLQGIPEEGEDME